MQPNFPIARPSTWRRRLAVGTVILAPLAIAACGSSSGSTASPTSDAKPAATAPAPAKDTVNIKLIAYRPSKMTVTAGATVTWNQMDAGTHTITSGTVAQAPGGVTQQPDGMFASGEIATGKKYTHTFAKPGTYKYFCEIHPATMTGEITVK